MKIIQKILLLAACSVAITSCNLDLTPSTEISKDNAFTNYADAQRLANGLNASYRNTLYGLFSMTSEVQGDMYNASVMFGNRYGSPHQMYDNFTTGDYNTCDIWQGVYKGIENVNVFLEGIDKIVVSKESEKQNIKQWKGFAYFYRAAFYHQLVLKYAYPYKEATAASDMGVPVVTTYDVEAKPARASMANTYKRITDDIAQAYTLLADVTGAPLSITPTKDAITALDARVQLCMGKFPEAATLAQSLINSGTYPLAKTKEEMTKVWLNDEGTEAIFQTFASLSEYGQAKISPNSEITRLANIIYLSYVDGGKYYRADFIPTKTCIEMYEPQDLRWGAFFQKSFVTYGATKDSIYLLNKYAGNPTLFTPPSRNYAQKSKAFTISEMYLIAAEANFKAGQIGAAKIALNNLQDARGATQTEATFENIKKEWAKETIGEGFRIDCLKRWNDGYKGRVPQNDVIITPGPNFQNIDIPAGYQKLTWPIPDDDIKTNPNLKPNW